MDSRIDPPTSLRQKHFERIRHDRAAFSLRKEHHLAVGECAEEDGSEETVLSQEEEVLLMESGDNALTILSDDFGLDDERYPIVAGGLARLESEHGETAG